jgi:cobalamin biosynthesis Mg chelatase CobN
MATQTAKNPALDYIVPIGTTVVLGFGAWQLTKYLKEQAESKRIDATREETLKHTLNIQKTSQNIAGIEQRANFTGINGYNKKVTANPILLAKEAIRERFNVINLQSGKTVYNLKNPDKVDFNILFDRFMKTPINALSVFSKTYTAYTGRQFFDDTQGFTPTQRETAKAVLSVATKKFPTQWR